MTPRSERARPRIRPAGSEDLPAVVAVLARARVASPYYEESVEVAAEIELMAPRVAGYVHGSYHPSHALAPRAMWVAEAGDETVGFLASHASTRMGCEAELQWMFVLPEWQRRGVGARLLPPLAAWCSARELRRVVIDAPPANPYRRFYLKHGAVPLDGYWLYWPDIERDTAHLRAGGEVSARETR